MVKGCEARLRGMDCGVLHRKFQNWHWPSIMMDVVDPMLPSASQGVVQTQNPPQPTSGSVDFSP